MFPRNLINSKGQSSRGRLPRQPTVLVALLLCFGAGVLPHFTDGETETWKISDRAEVYTLTHWPGAVHAAPEAREPNK